jgi:hypothetical protein
LTRNSFCLKSGVTCRQLQGPVENTNHPPDACERVQTRRNRTLRGMPPASNTALPPLTKAGRADNIPASIARNGPPAQGAAADAGSRPANVAAAMVFGASGTRVAG